MGWRMGCWGRGHEAAHFQVFRPMALPVRRARWHWLHASYGVCGLGVFVRGERMTGARIHLSANPVEAHKTLSDQVWKQVKALAMDGHATVVEIRIAEDCKTDKQRRYLHGCVLLNIAMQADVNGQKFPMCVWKEHFRAEFLGFKTRTHKNPITGKKVRRRERVSTEDLGVKGYNEYIERVTAFAVTDLGVEFPDGWVDPTTGEIWSRTRPLALLGATA